MRKRLKVLSMVMCVLIVVITIFCGCDSKVNDEHMGKTQVLPQSENENNSVVGAWYHEDVLSTPKFVFYENGTCDIANNGGRIGTWSLIGGQELQIEFGLGEKLIVNYKIVSIDEERMILKGKSMIVNGETTESDSEELVYYREGKK